MTTTAPKPESCPYCGCVPHDNIGQCPSVKEVEYFPDGQVKRVVKHSDSEYTKRFKAFFDFGRLP